MASPVNYTSGQCYKPIYYSNLVRLHLELYWLESTTLESEITIVKCTPFGHRSSTVFTCTYSCGPFLWWNGFYSIVDSVLRQEGKKWSAQSEQYLAQKPSNMTCRLQKQWCVTNIIKEHIIVLLVVAVVVAPPNIEWTLAKMSAKYYERRALRKDQRAC